LPPLFTKFVNKEGIS